MITADLIRQLIVDHDNDRPRSKQKTLGPSELGTPCPRRLAHRLLDTPPVVQPQVSLAAWVGTGIHTQMEHALADNPDWETEVPILIDLGKGLKVTGTLDAYHHPTRTVVDWKGVGPAALTKYRAASPDGYLTQVAIYGLGVVLSGRWGVDNTAIAYIPRNGQLADIHLDVHPWDQDRADRALERYTQLAAATKAGPAVLPLIPTGQDCNFCPWWNPNAWADGQGCPGHQAPQATHTPVDGSTTQHQEKETAHV